MNIPQTGAIPGEFLFESKGLPVESVRLRLPEPNTVVPVRIYHRRVAKEPWHEVASTVVYRLNRADEEMLSPVVPVSCTSGPYWRILFDQRGGGIGQGSPHIDLGWVAQQGIFVARGSGPFFLSYGNANIAPADFPVATLVPGYRAEEYPTLPGVTFDAPVSLTASPSGVSNDSTPNWRSIGLWGVLIAGVAALGAMVWRLRHQIDGRQS